MDVSIIIIGLILLLIVIFLRRVLIYEYESGLLYRSGKFSRILTPGWHWIILGIHKVNKLDIRSRVVILPGQELLTQDNISIRISLAATFKVVDPYLAVHTSINYHESLYAWLQVALRDLVGERPIDELMGNRRALGEKMLESCKEKTLESGLLLESVSIRDVMFPGDLKNIFAQVVNARLQGLAALERARGEMAALRSMANAAKLLEGNPGLYQLRILEMLSSSQGHTLVLSMGEDGNSELKSARKKGKANS